MRNLLSTPSSCMIAAIAALLLSCTLLWGGPAAAQRIDMRNSKHNLTQSVGASADPRQICVFCHTPTTPASSDTAQPKWQSEVPQDGIFIMFDDIGRLGKEGSEAVGSQSIACLSCHDSAQAFGIAGGSLDHPYAVPYRGALSPEQREKIRNELRQTGKLINTGKEIKFDDFRQASRGLVDNRPVWWVSRDTVSAQRGRLDVPLYVRIDQYDQTEIPFVECASCHDPHTIRPLFLRAEGDPSSLCLTCHVK